MAERRKIFNPATTPLNKGLNLVEASAGTGKTYAIAMLVLRLIIEHSLKIDEILIVTFTRAATQELADRIRQRLNDAKEYLTGAAVNVDPVLRNYVEGIQDTSVAIEAVSEALHDVDRAAIFTIHGFCQRMLQEQALESGQLFDVELQPEIESIRLNLTKDFWRKRIYPLSRRHCSVILQYFDTPEKLYKSIQPIGNSYNRIEPDVGELGVAKKHVENAFKNLVLWWNDNRDRLHDSLVILCGEGKLKKNFVQSFPQWFGDVDNFLQKRRDKFPSLEYINWLQDQGFIKIVNGARVRGAKKDEMVASLELPNRETEQLLKCTDELILSLRRSLALYLIEETESALYRNNCMSYDDLIVRMHHSVTGGVGHFNTIVRNRFHAALIDEFQDTDILQWEIFNSLFGRGNHYLYLIGDPKQAIYRFRGADIYSYFQARKSANDLLTLKDNYRSHPHLVNAVNDLFTSQEKPFVYTEDILSYEPVDPALTGDSCNLLYRGQSRAGMVYCQLASNPDSANGTWNSGSASQVIRHYVVAETAKLLRQATIQQDETTSRKLLPGDIAILVKKHTQAEEYRQHLTQSGIPAVLISRQSVYLTNECKQLHILLRSIAEPGNTTLLKQAMTIPWFGLQGNELYAIWQDEEEFSRLQLKFNEYSELWRKKGVFAMMNHLLEEEQVFPTVGSMELAERKIANISHLLELIQQVETDAMYGPLQLLQWLKKQMVGTSSEDELRLESDDEAVKIITMHSAKGLEFSVVFCPYLWYRQRKVVTGFNSIVTHTGNEQILDLGSANYINRLQKAEGENLAEETRLLYVAATRAKLRSYMLWADIQGRKNGPYDAFESSLGNLLFSEGRCSFADQQTLLKNAGRKNFCEYELVEPGNEPSQAIENQSDISAELKARVPRQTVFLADWQMTSYSALATTSEHSLFQPNTDESDRTDESPLQFAELPSGAHFGNVVHEILESFTFKGLQNPGSHRQEIRRIVNKYRVDLDVELLEKMLSAIVQTKISSHIPRCTSDFSLADLKEENCLKEMGFYYHLQRGQASEINHFLAREKTYREINERALTGYLTGFIDLIFQYDNQFFIVDFKTNNLGDQTANYSVQHLEDAMAVHNYGLQFWIYSLVLHRHLQNFHAGYDYQKHFGGVLYLFVRGMALEGKGVYFHKPDQLTIEYLEKYFGER